MAVFVEDWGASYGSAYLVTQDDTGSASAELVEDGQDLAAARRRAPGAPVTAPSRSSTGSAAVRRRCGRRTRLADRAAVLPAGMRAAPSSPIARASASVTAGYGAWSSGARE